MHQVARENADVVHTHFAGDVGKYLVPILQLYPEHRIGQRLDNLPFHEDRVILRFTQNTTFFRRAELRTATWPRPKDYPKPPAWANAPRRGSASLVRWRRTLFRSHGSVSTSGPSEVTAIVCSK